MESEKKPNVMLQDIKVKGGQLLDKVREIVEEGNARRVIIKKEDRTLLEFPLSVGVGGAAAAVFLAPTLAAIGAVAALVTDVHIQIESATEESGIIVSPNDTKGDAGQ